MQEGDWQLELLCNVAAAEFLMPIGSLPKLEEMPLSIDALMGLRHKYDVSAEALLLRVVRLTDSACTVFCTSRLEEGKFKDRYRIDYAVGSRSWQSRLASGVLLPESTVLRECTAIGFTAKATEQWPDVPQPVSIEAVGIPPYPKHIYPRVVGIAQVPESTGGDTPENHLSKGRCNKAARGRLPDHLPSRKRQGTSLGWRIRTSRAAPVPEDPGRLQLLGKGT